MAASAPDLPSVFVAEDPVAPETVTGLLVSDFMSLGATDVRCSLSADVITRYCHEKKTTRKAITAALSTKR